MNTETLKKAIHLNSKIKQLEYALNCFEYTDLENEDLKYSTNPVLIIEHDGDGREETKLPITISDSLIELIKKEIRTNLKKAESEFKKL